MTVTSLSGPVCHCPRISGLQTETVSGKLSRSFQLPFPTTRIPWKDLKDLIFSNSILGFFEPKSKALKSAYRFA